jgi:predicted methyltransferase
VKAEWIVRVCSLAGFFCLGALFVTSGCSGPGALEKADYKAIVASPDRSAADREIDLRRKPDQLLAFTGVRPGMRVLDMGAGAGYSTELLARAVGSQGIVYAQDSAALSDRARSRFDERLKKPVMKKVVRLIRDYDDPVPSMGELDLITFFFAYHDTAYMNVDRAKMNRRLFEALAAGGTLVLADHSAQPGAGLAAVKSLHRIEESVVRSEIEAAGFKLVDEADFLRNPDDRRDAPVFRPKIPVDEFVLKFVKPKDAAAK